MENISLRQGFGRKNIASRTTIENDMTHEIQCNKRVGLQSTQRLLS